MSGSPLMRDTAKALATFVGRVDPRQPFVEGRTVFANALPADPWWSRVTHIESRGTGAARKFARETLERVGLGSCADQPVAKLVPWRRRRVGIAREMIRRRDHRVAHTVAE